MVKIKEFFCNLKKSTKITMVSCGCFIALTVVILGFFMLCPINPSDSFLKAIGRESISNQPTTSGSVTTAQDYVVNGTTTTSLVTHNPGHSEFEITITTGKGFVTGYVIPTGTPGENNYTTSAEEDTTATEDTSDTTEDTSTTEPEENTEPTGDTPVTTEPPAPTTEAPKVTEGEEE